MAVGIVTAVASTEGMVATIISSLFGATISALTIALLVVITVGVVLAAAHVNPPRRTFHRFQAEDPDPRSGPVGVMKRIDGARTRSALLVVPVAILFGITIYTTGHAGTEAPIIWVLLPARLSGTALIASPLLVSRKLRISLRTFPLVLAAALGEIGGLASYTFGARQQLAVAAVLATPYTAITAVAAFFLFGERLRRHQILGVAIVVAGVVTLSALTR